MLRLKNKAFTIIELLIVIVVIGLLALLVLNNVGGATADARDAQRKNNINALHSQLEAYYARNSVYPREADMADNAVGGWLDTNMVGLDLEATVDPAGPSINETGGYTYVATPTNCDNGDVVGPCTGYTLTAVLETSDDDFVKTSLN